MDLGLRRDIAVSRRVRLTLSADVFNLLNKQDTYLSSKSASIGGTYNPANTDSNPNPLTSQQNWTGLSTYNWPARQIQLGARFAF
jgi:hypothetical protein